MKVKDYPEKKVNKPKEVSYLKELRDSVELGINGVEKKLNRFVENFQAIEESLRLIVQMATIAINHAEKHEGPVPESYREYIYGMLHQSSLELTNMKMPLKIPKEESEILHALIVENQLLKELIFEEGGKKSIRKFGNIKDNQEKKPND